MIGMIGGRAKDLCTCIGAELISCQSGVWTKLGGGKPKVQSFWLDNQTTLGKWDFCYLSTVRDIGAVKVDVQVWESGGIWYGARRGYTEGANAICVTYQ